jgi:RNA polymerase sigma factor (sigma-70 family)
LDEGASLGRFNEVVLPHLSAALSLARWITGNTSDAEDVVQEACLNAFNGMASYDGGNAKAWLLTIVRRTSYRWLSQNRKPVEKAVGDLTDLEEATTLSGANINPKLNPETNYLANASVAALEAAITTLPEPFRETLVLRDINELSYREIATMIEVPMGTVMSRLARARSLLKTELEKSR